MIDSVIEHSKLHRLLSDLLVRITEAQLTAQGRNPQGARVLVEKGFPLGSPKLDSIMRLLFFPAMSMVDKGAFTADDYVFANQVVAMEQSPEAARQIMPLVSSLVDAGLAIVNDKMVFEPTVEGRPILREIIKAYWHVVRSKPDPLIDLIAPMVEATLAKI